MSVIVAPLQRKFIFKGEELPDPDNSLSPVQVLEFYSGKYPELAAATVPQPKDEDGTYVYELEYNVGTKA